jgi:hypothetical protein
MGNVITASSQLILFVSIIFGVLLSDNRIILHLKHAPEEIIQESIAEAKRQKLFDTIDEKTPGAVNHKIMKGAYRSYFTPILNGFMAIYGGYMDISNHDGLLMFPLRHAVPKIYVAISPSIDLVKVKGETISHREFMLGEESKLYLLERNVDDKKNIYWRVTEEKIPIDKKISPITLVIFAKTKNIIIPTGDFLLSESSHLILPDFYVIGNNDQAKIALQALDIKRYFESIVQEKKKASENALQKMVTNI